MMIRPRCARRRSLLCACATLAILAPRPSLAVNDVSGTLLTFNTNGGWCWFQDPRIVVDNNQILIGSIAGTTANGAAAGDVRVTSYDLASQAASTFTLHPSLQTDDHDAPALTLLPDGRYMAVYQKHGSDNLARWRISTSPGSIASWNPELTGTANPANDGNGNTYANPFYLSVPNKVYSFSRSVGYDPNYSVFSGLNPADDSSLTYSYGGHALYWMNPNNGANGANGGPGRPYVKYASNGTDKIWFVTTEDHPRNYYNSLYAGYVQFDASGVGTVHRSDGSIIPGSNGRISTARSPYPAPSNNSSPALASGTGYSYSPTAFTNIFSSTPDGNTVASWANDVELDPAGNPFAVFSVRRNNPADAYVPNALDYYYARFDGTDWAVHRMAYAGTTLYNGENDYAGLATLDPNNPDSVYISTNYTPDTDVALAHWEIYHGTTADGGATWSWSPVTSNSTADNLRPMLADVDSSRVALTWMRGTYTSYTNFNTSVVGLILPSSGPVSSLLAYWTGRASTSLADSSNNWGSTASGTTNFSTDAAGAANAAHLPDSNTAVIFSAANASGVAGTLSTRLDADYALRSLTFDVPPATAISSTVIDTSAHSLTLGAGGLTLSATSSSSATLSGAGPVSLAATQFWANNSNTHPLTVATAVRPASAGPTTLAFAGSGSAPIVVTGPISDGAGTLSLTNQSGLTVLTGSNTYTGPTILSGGALRATVGVSVPASSNLTLSGGTLLSSGSFSRTLGPAAGQIQFTAGAPALAADDAGDLSVTLLNGGSPISWGSASFNPSTLTFNTPASAHNVTLAADLDLGSATRNVRVNGALATLSGVITGSSAGTLGVDGPGTLVLSNPNNSYAGITRINSVGQGPGTLRAAAPNALGTGAVAIGTVGNSSSARLELAAYSTLPNPISLGGRNNLSVGIENVSGNNTLSGTLTMTVGGTVYQIQSDAGSLTLSGAAGGGVAVTSTATSLVRTLTLQGPADGSITGAIQNGTTGATLAIAKAGAGTWTLSGSNTYTGPTTVTAGTLVLTPGAFAPVTSTPGGAILNGGQLVLDYGANPSALPTTIVADLKASHDSSNFTNASQRYRTTNPNDPAHGIGYTNDPAAHRFTIAYTRYGDANLDGAITPDDYALLDRSYARSLTNAHWTDGDFNYDGLIDQQDYLLIDTTYAQSHPLTPSFLSMRESEFGAPYVSQLLAAVPEPSLPLLAACSLALPLLTRRRT